MVRSSNFLEPNTFRKETPHLNILTLISSKVRNSQLIELNLPVRKTKYSTKANQPVHH